MHLIEFRLSRRIPWHIESLTRLAVCVFAAVFSLVPGMLKAQATTHPATAPATPPNVVLILMDDLGWRDVSYNGSPLAKTPNIDRLARDGKVFTNAYAAAPICSPSRVAILTGQSPARAKFEFVTKWPADRVSEGWPLKPPPFTYDLPLERVTIADALSARGIVTAMVGKWHVAAHHGKYNGWSLTHGPRQQGFDVAIDEGGAHPAGGPLPKPAKTFVEGEYPEDRLTTRGIEFLQERAADRKPFFFYVAHYYPHDPIGNVPEWLIQQKKAELGDAMPMPQVRYAAFVQQADHYIGQLIDALDASGLRENTMVIFTSDNGGTPDLARNAPLRGSKWNLYEGGIRVPMIVRWPRVAEAGSVCDVPIIGHDLFPTVLESMGTSAPAGDADWDSIDGISLLPLIRGDRESPPSLAERSLYWHFPYYVPERPRPDLVRGIGVDTNSSRTINPPMAALRNGKFKLIHFFEDNRSELYDLQADPSEARDLSAEQPEVRATLEKTLLDTLRSVGGRMPSTKQ